MHQRPDTGADQGDRDRDERPEQRERRIDLSVPQVAGSALAAVAAAVLASRLGVYGTIIGAGVVSVVATCGGSVFQHLFSRTGDQLREATAPARPRDRRVPAPSATHPMPHGDTPTRALLAPGTPGAHGTHGVFGEATTHGTRVRGWKRPVIAAGVVFGVAMAGITGFELLSGSGLDGGKGTTVGSVVRGGDDKPADDPSRSPDHRPEPERTGTPGQGGDRSPAPGRDQGEKPADPAPSPSRPAGPETGPTGPGPTDPSGPSGPTGPQEPSAPAVPPSAPATGGTGPAPGTTGNR
ncbi:hypothetical protein ACIBCM_22945 [Streptomyces sp. NPDC051018]|uniref:hypothetical protein n=1 Tax=Streptomyces sp. NPDC051018 TaxID=3365639 RepID=UPI00379426EB